MGKTNHVKRTRQVYNKYKNLIYQESPRISKFYIAKILSDSKEFKDINDNLDEIKSFEYCCKEIRNIIDNNNIIVEDEPYFFSIMVEMFGSFNINYLEEYKIFIKSDEGMEYMKTDRFINL